MERGELEPWELALGFVVVAIIAIQTWWDFAEGRVRGPIGHFDRSTSPAGFWWIQGGRLAFVVMAVGFIGASLAQG
jgi:hypothetical protein